MDDKLLVFTNKQTRAKIFTECIWLEKFKSLFGFQFASSNRGLTGLPHLTNFSIHTCRYGTIDGNKNYKLAVKCFLVQLCIIICPICIRIGLSDLLVCQPGFEWPQNLASGLGKQQDT